LLNSRPAGGVIDLPDLGFLTAELAERAGVLTEAEGEVRAATLPAAWDGGLWQALESLFPCLFRLQTWGPLEGYRGDPVLSSPFPAGYLITLTLLGHQAEGKWVRPAMIEEWVQSHHPYWRSDSLRPSRKGPWAAGFLLGLCLPMKIVQAAADGDGGYAVRLTAFGRWLMANAEKPPVPAAFPRTLLVQPNLEILAYRQGLTPSLVARLTRAATWKTVGAACTLQVEAETVYRALEAGESLESLTRMLDQHGTRPTPAGVLDLLRTWSNKRDRITVYPAATLLEFSSPRELEEALARGVSGVRATDTVLVVPSEDQVEFRHFRLAGTRDYGLAPERCVSVEADGVTLSVDLGKSDLMLETELPRIAELLDRAAANNRRLYRLTPASMARARENGWTLTTLEGWFNQRVGQPATPAARLLLGAGVAEPPTVRTHLVLHVASPEFADGLEQWPATRELIASRLGPTALAIEEANVEPLRKLLAELG
ncbi:MAG: helicase-associated domain-containing protein, partial [Gemmataceae bacterium]